MSPLKTTALALLALNALAATAASASVIRCESRLQGEQYVTFGHAGGTSDRPMVLEISHPAQGAVVLKSEGNIPLTGHVSVLADGRYDYDFGILAERDSAETVQIDYENGYSPSRAMYYLNVWEDGGELIDTRESIELRVDPAHPENAVAIRLRSDRMRSPIDGTGLFAHWDAPVRTDMPVSCTIAQ